METLLIKRLQTEDMEQSSHTLIVYRLTRQVVHRGV